MADDEVGQMRSEVAQLREMVQTLAQAVAMSGENGDEGGGDSGDEEDSWQDVVPTIGGIGNYGAFRWDGAEITHCHFQFGRDVHSISDVQASGDGTYYLKVPHEYGGLNASIITTQESSDLTKTIIPLFKIEDGKITKDYRGMPVIPVRE